MSNNGDNGLKFDAKKAARQGVADLPSYVPGKPEWEIKKEYGVKEVVKLASNESPLPPPESVVEAACRAVAGASRYPDGACTDLKAALADRLMFNPGGMMLGTGADECIRIIAMSFIRPGTRCVIPAPSFDAYRNVSVVAGAEVVTVQPGGDLGVDLDAVLSAVDAETSAVWLCSPNNPTGKIIVKSDFDKFLERLPENVLVVLDEAYREFVTDGDAVKGEDYIEDGRVISLRTFSKAFALAGLRVGYAVAHPSLIEVMNRVRPPFNVSLPAQAAALASLQEEDFVAKLTSLIVREREFLRLELAKRWCPAPASQANFLFARTPKPAREIFESMLPLGVAVRPGDAWEMPDRLRITVGDREQNTKLLHALDQVLGAQGG
jgi:histidinol-phosphate aminotransferase